MKTNFTYWSDWDSLNPFQKLNWRDFTFIKLSVEFNPTYNDIHIAFLGLHFTAAYYKVDIDDIDFGGFK